MSEDQAQIENKTAKVTDPVSGATTIHTPVYPTEVLGYNGDDFFFMVYRGWSKLSIPMQIQVHAHSV